MCMWGMVNNLICIWVHVYNCMYTNYTTSTMCGWVDFMWCVSTWVDFVCACVCVCSLLLGNPNFKDPLLSLSTSGLGDCKVARVGRPATDYKLVVRPWESGI